jgi:hypothetical protein
VRWVPLGSGPGVTMDDVDALIGTPQGYVAALATEPATVAVSEDGDAWEMVRLDRDPDAKSTVTTLATDGRRILAVGGSSPCPHEAFWVEVMEDGEVIEQEGDPPASCQVLPMSWLSDDGRTWQRGATWPGPTDASGWTTTIFGPAWSLAAGAWEAVALRVDPDSDGIGPWWLARSSDGLEWQPLGEGRDDEAFDWVVRGEQDQRLAARGSSCGQLHASTDGLTYRLVAGTEAPCDRYVSALAPDAGGPWVVLSNRMTGPDGPAEGPIAMWSSDLESWTVAGLPSPPAGRDGVVAHIEAMTEVDGGHLAVGGDGGSALTWISDDGQTWTLADARELTEDSRDIRLIASGPAGTIGLGCDDEMCGGVQAWRLETSAPAT